MDMLMGFQDTAALDDGGSPSVLERGGDIGVVAGALRSLQPLDREVLVLRYRDQLSLSAIAELTESTLGEVHQRLRRAAMAVEEQSGRSAAVTSATPREDDAALEDLRLGITPQLAERIGRAVIAADLPAVSDGRRTRRRLRAEAWLRVHLSQLATMTFVAGAATLTIVSMGG